MKKVAVIGLGNRCGWMMGLLQKSGRCCLVGVADANLDRSKEKIKEWIEDSQSLIDSLQYYDLEDFHDLIRNTEPDAVLVGTRCSAHARIASELLSYNIPVFLEKPVATTLQDLKILENARRKYPEAAEKCLVSFPMRCAPLVAHARSIVASGVLGTIQHVQAVNNVPYGRGYFHSWMRDENETGGLWLQKATHDLDYINSILRIKPVSICAMSSKQIFKGDKPAGTTCLTCSDRDVCPENMNGVYKYEDMFMRPDRQCSFAVDTGNHDSGSCIIRYDSGMHAVYSQNFYVRNGAGKRGGRFIGYNGTMEFDWYTGDIQVHMHNINRNDVYHFDASISHGGGDHALAENFIDILYHDARPTATLDDGILSALMCLKAEESCRTQTFREIMF